MMRKIGLKTWPSSVIVISVPAPDGRSAYVHDPPYGNDGSAMRMTSFDEGSITSTRYGTTPCLPCSRTIRPWPSSGTISTCFTSRRHSGARAKSVITPNTTAGAAASVVVRDARWPFGSIDPTSAEKPARLASEITTISVHLSIGSPALSRRRRPRRARQQVEAGHRREALALGQATEHGAQPPRFEHGRPAHGLDALRRQYEADTPAIAVGRGLGDIAERLEPRHGLRERGAREIHVTREQRQRRGRDAVEVDEDFGIARRQPKGVGTPPDVACVAGVVDLRVAELHAFDGLVDGHGLNLAGAR